MPDETTGATITKVTCNTCGAVLPEGWMECRAHYQKTIADQKEEIARLEALVKIRLLPLEDADG